MLWMIYGGNYLRLLLPEERCLLRSHVLIVLRAKLSTRVFNLKEVRRKGNSSLMLSF